MYEKTEKFCFESIYDFMFDFAIHLNSILKLKK